MELRCTETQFLKDVERHQMTIEREGGMYRHLRFRAPGNGLMYFDILTWPGYLCIAGDMGNYLFERLPDMFVFFRHSDGRSRINPDYWSEKVRAADKDDVTSYNPERFIQEITLWELPDLDDDDEAMALRRNIFQNVISFAREGERTAREAARHFKYKGERLFAGFEDTDLRDFTYRFVWCCYAIVWGIDQYDCEKRTTRDAAMP